MGWQEYPNGWCYKKADGTWATSEWLTINGHKYYFNDGGYAVTGWVQLDYWYYFTETKTDDWPKCSMQHGLWIKYNNDNNKWCYLEPTTGHMLANTWRQIGGYWYYFNEHGYALKDWQSIDGYYYYFHTQNETDNYGNYWLACSMHKGWLKYENKWYFLDSDQGYMYANTVTKADGYLYSFTASGAMQEGSGWETIDNQWYYFSNDPPTGHLESDWFKEVWTDGNEYTYYLSPSDGHLYLYYNQFVTILNKKYYYPAQSSSIPAGSIYNPTEGWYTLANQNNNQYYFYADGSIAIDTYVTSPDGTALWYMNSNGVHDTSQTLTIQESDFDVGQFITKDKFEQLKWLIKTEVSGSSRREQSHSYSAANTVNAKGVTINASQTNNLIDAYNKIYSNTFTAVQTNTDFLAKQTINSSNFYTWKNLYKRTEHLRTTYPDKYDHSYAHNAGCDGDCRGLCSGCTGSCLGTCLTGCTGQCKGCGSGCASTCTGTCTRACAQGCGSGCAGTCWQTCNSNCEGGCNTTCTGQCQGCGMGCSNGCVDPGRH